MTDETNISRMSMFTSYRMTISESYKVYDKTSLKRDRIKKTMAL